MSNRITLPRFFYRSVQQAAADIRQDTQQLGSVRQAMCRYLEQYTDKLTDRKPEDLVVVMLETAENFCAAESGITPETLKQEIQSAVAGMDEETAFVYLATMEAAMKYCTFCVVLDPDDTFPSSEKMVHDITRILENPGERSLAERIDQLTDSITQNGLQALTYAMGNQPLLQALTDPDSPLAHKGEIALHALDNSLGKAETYAIYACACYGQILEGNVQGVTADNIDPGLLTALVCAGISKGTILQRLMRGEIDRELAMDLLDRVEAALKWVVTKCFQILVGYVVLKGSLYLIALLGATGGLASALTFLGIVISGFAILGVEEDMRELTNFLADLIKAAVSLTATAGKKVASVVQNAMKSKAQVEA